MSGAFVPHKRLSSNLYSLKYVVIMFIPVDSNLQNHQFILILILIKAKAVKLFCQFNFD
jgi:hypothetical protein